MDRYHSGRNDGEAFADALVHFNCADFVKGDEYNEGFYDALQEAGVYCMD